MNTLKITKQKLLTISFVAAAATAAVWRFNFGKEIGMNVHGIGL